MSHTVTVHVDCVSCRTPLELDVVSPFEDDDQRHADNLHAAVNELLVDLGWLPGHTGPYCPVHAAELR